MLLRLYESVSVSLHAPISWAFYSGLVVFVTYFTRLFKGVQRILIGTK